MKKPKKLRSSKAGFPPGSLIHIGEIKMPETSFTLIDYDDQGLAERPLGSSHDFATAPRPFKLRWANIYGIQKADDLKEIGQTFNLHPLVQEDILNNAQRQKIDAYDDYLYLVLHRYELKNPKLELMQDQISLVLGHDFVLSFQERQSRTFEPVRQRIRTEHSSLRKGGADTLAYSLIDAVVDSYFAVIEQLDDHAEQLEMDILSHAKPSTLEAIHQFKRTVSQLRRNLQPLREILGFLHRDSDNFFRPEVALYIRDVYDHTVHILESLEDLRDQASGLLDVYLTTVSHRVNLEVRTLTVVATIFMPATLIAGIFGMNFRSMPWLELGGGYLYALGLMAAIAVVMLILFWRRRLV
ncbi:magnesium/cobalt transporter CorA [Dechloromonas sp. TW-R-39-2]|uniref:magnesium/cobalt transporter CorA n=1 Tax=Dechloromonas sp. TW-R-39-2 TaxID=2654218 RepID=UPI00193DE14E|nr:magnesium/cobalt transporter CorA [Dechloromonas sp. TW-R-39-2]QRM18847.1 magnesium/cobalt transporter CorA [Dechloromonas sp. TW-R-39-2]